MKPDSGENDAKNTVKGVIVTILIIGLVIFGMFFIMIQSCGQSLQ